MPSGLVLLFNFVFPEERLHATHIEGIQAATPSPRCHNLLISLLTHPLSSEGESDWPLANTSSLSRCARGRSQRENVLSINKAWPVSSTPLICSSSLSAPVAVHHHHPGGEGADHRSVSGLSLPGGQHLLATLVGIQPTGGVAAAGCALPDLLWHVRLHGPGVHWWAPPSSF